MKLERITDQDHSLFQKAFALYESAFPVEERRDSAEQQRVMRKADYHFELITENDAFIGVMLFWEIDQLIFLEHFTTLPAIRGKGYGAKALELLKQKGKLILLEIEPPVDVTTERRYGFYKRNGFVMNPYHHIQAKYHLGDPDLELKVLSYPRALTQEEYTSFYEYMTREIGIRPHMANDIVIRKLRDEDDLDQVAKLIYDTDPYIYPNWFDSLEDGIKVLREMIDLPTLYNRENIAVAVMPDGTIAGAIISKQAPFTEDLQSICRAFDLAGVKCDERTQEVFEAYYSKMGKEEDGYYIANVAVDPMYRKRGIAAALMDHAMEGKRFCTLECVVANAGAWRLYQRLGFQIDFEYPGVHGIPCYKMYYEGR